MAVKFNSVTVLSYENGQALQGRANEIENAINSCMVDGMRAAPVRIVLRDGVTRREFLMAMRAFGPMLDDMPMDGVGESTIGYVP